MKPELQWQIRGGGGPPAPPLLLDQTEATRAFWENAPPPPPPYLRVWMIQVVIVLIQVYNWEIRHHSLVFRR